MGCEETGATWLARAFNHAMDGWCVAKAKVKHAAHCLSIDNVLGRHDCDCRDWHTGNPPSPGLYRLLVDIDIHDNGKPSRSERREYWDGERWSTLGAYARPVCWCAVIPPSLDRNAYI